MFFKGKEIWLSIKAFPDYEISNEGRVRHVRFNRLLTIGRNSEYPIIGLRKNGKRYWKAIHRLVAETFYLHVKYRNQSHKGYHFEYYED